MPLLQALRPTLPILIGASLMLSLSMGLRQSLGINMAGIAVVLDLMDQICALQDENHRLRRRQ